MITGKWIEICNNSSILNLNKNKIVKNSNSSSDLKKSEIIKGNKFLLFRTLLLFIFLNDISQKDKVNENNKIEISTSESIISLNNITKFQTNNRLQCLEESNIDRDCDSSAKSNCLINNTQNDYSFKKKKFIIDDDTNLNQFQETLIQSIDSIDSKNVKNQKSDYDDFNSVTSSDFDKLDFKFLKILANIISILSYFN